MKNDNNMIMDTRKYNIFSEEFSHIHDNIYLGSLPNTKTINKFDVIINCSEYHYDMVNNEGKIFFAYPFKDENRLPDMKNFWKIVDLMYSLWDKDIFIHCFAGLNRSAFMVGAYLIKYKYMTPKETISLIRKKRDSSCLSNDVFREYLENIHDKCHPSHEMRYSDSSYFDSVCNKCGTTDENSFKLRLVCEPSKKVIIC